MPLRSFRLRVLIGLGVPVLAVVLGIPLLSGSHVMVLGMPLMFAWLVAWMPLTSLCLAVCWFGHDRHLADDAS